MVAVYLSQGRGTALLMKRAEVVAARTTAEPWPTHLSSRGTQDTPRAAHAEISEV